MTGAGVTPQTAPYAANVLLGLDYPANEYEYNGNIKGANRYWRLSNGGTLDTMTNTYAYDNLNRLTSYNFNATGATTLSGVYNYSMDEFGNLLEQVKQSGSGQSPLGHANTVDRGTNRLSSVNYDLLGNQTQVSNSGGNSNLVYLDQGHVYDLKSADGATLLYRYYYDAEGKRRAKAKAVSGTVSLADNCSFFFYSGEDLICQKDLGVEVVPDSDTPTGVNGAYYQPKFLLTDHLGTTRAELMFDPATLQPKLAKTYDTMPYGELINTPTGRAEPVLFTGKLRDSETGLDILGERIFSSLLCRFQSADKFTNDTWVVDPSSWNLYTYCRNNPMLYTDPSGEKIYVGGLSSSDQTEVIKRLNYAYGANCVSVGSDGYLTVNTSGLSADILTATADLTNAIDTTTWFAEIQVSNDDTHVAFGENRRGRGSVPWNHTRRNADLIVLDFGDDRQVNPISDPAARDSFLNLVLVHEIFHGFPGLRDSAWQQELGDDENVVNRIRQARGLLLRARYVSDKFMGTGHMLEIPFGHAARDKSGNIIHNKSGGIEVEAETGKIIFWLKANVGRRGIN